MLPVVGWNETADRRQFSFSSILFHDVRRALVAGIFVGPYTSWI